MINPTLNIVLTRFRQFVDNHLQLKRCSFGNLDTIDLEKFGSYPLLHVVPVSESIDTVCTWTIDIYILDKPRDKDEFSKQQYQRHVLSDTAQIMRDIMANIVNGGNVFQFDENWSIVPVEVQYNVQVFNHTLSGVTATIQISAPWGLDACDLPLTGVSPADLTCQDVIVEVNDTAYGTAPSGTTFDVVVEYENGTPVGELDGGIWVIPNPSACPDGTVTVNDEAFGTVPSGGTLDVPVEYDDGTPVGSLVDGVWVIPDPVCPDATVENSDDTYSDTVASGATLVLPDITITKPDDTTVSYPSVKNVDIRTYRSGIEYHRPDYSQKTSSATGDEGWQMQAGTYNYTSPPYPISRARLNFTVAAANVFYTVQGNNAFGNSSRFTDTIGAAVGNGVGLAFIDHLTGLMWYGTQQGQATWANAFNTVNTANSGGGTGGYTDWRLPSVGELVTTFNYEGASAAFTTPFENFASFTIWTATSNPAAGTQAMVVFAGRAVTAQNKTVSTNRVVLVRTFYP